jgi:hypothetical protein
VTDGNFEGHFNTDRQLTGVGWNPWRDFESSETKA